MSIILVLANSPKDPPNVKIGIIYLTVENHLEPAPEQQVPDHCLSLHNPVYLLGATSVSSERVSHTASAP